MKNIIILIGCTLACLFPCFSQNFTFHSDAPFGIQISRLDSSRVAQSISFHDYDADGDLDIFMTGLDYIDDFENWEGIHFFIEMQENIGTPYDAQFGEREDIFDAFPYPIGYFLASPGDLNNDSKTDFIVGADIDEIGNEKLRMLLNTGMPGPKQFDVTALDSMRLDDFVPESFFIPHLTDLDGDGDLDLMCSGFNSAFAEEDGPDVPIFYYARNTGSKQIPEFQGWYPDPYGLAPSPYGEILTSGDIDNDGDMDLVGSLFLIPEDSISYMLVHMNTPGPDGKPAFDEVMQSPFGLPISSGANQLLFPTLADIDSDGDLDLFVFEGNSESLTFKYYENSLCTGVINNLSVTLCEGESIVVGGIPYSDAGDYTISLEGSNDCDSTIQLSITVDPIQTTLLNESICEGELIVVGDELFDVSGDYMVFLVAANGCDSVVFLSLVVHETYQTNLDESICDGESVHVGEEEFTKTGEYEVMLLSEDGCDSLIFLSLVVNENYIVNLDETICNGDVYSVGLEDFTQTGHYEVLLFSQAGCDSLIALDLTVIEVDNSVILNENIITANQSGASYQWINCDSGENIPGASGQSYEVLVTGNYAVSITDGLGCVSISECVHVLITGLAEVALSNAITIYPNPTDGFINVIYKLQFPITVLTVTNLSGQVMGNFLPNERNSIDVTFLEQGVYFVKITVQEVVVIKKLIVI